MHQATLWCLLLVVVSSAISASASRLVNMPLTVKQQSAHVRLHRRDLAAQPLQQDSALLEQVANLQAALSNAAASNTTLRSEIMSQLAHVLFMLGRHEQALTMANNALALNPANTMAQEGVYHSSMAIKQRPADELNLAGAQLFTAREYEAAIQCFESALQASVPDHPVRLIYMCNQVAALLMLERYDDALGKVREALALAPAHPKALELLESVEEEKRKALLVPNCPDGFTGQTCELRASYMLFSLFIFCLN